MNRSSRNIVLTLLGSAALLGCCCTSCVDYRDEPVKDANGNDVRDSNGHVVYHRHYYYHPWYHSGGYYGGRSPLWTSTYGSYGSSSYTSPARTGSSSSSGSMHTSGATSRGGFGSTGHATAGG